MTALGSVGAVAALAAGIGSVWSDYRLDRPLWRSTLARASQAIRGRWQR